MRQIYALNIYLYIIDIQLSVIDMRSLSKQIISFAGLLFLVKYAIVNFLRVPPACAPGGRRLDPYYSSANTTGIFLLPDSLPPDNGQGPALFIGRLVSASSLTLSNIKG